MNNNYEHCVTISIANCGEIEREIERQLRFSVEKMKRWIFSCLNDFQSESEICLWAEKRQILGHLGMKVAVENHTLIVGNLSEVVGSWLWGLSHC